MALILMLALAPQSRGQQPSASLSVSANEKPYLVEWVYKVKWGHADEFWQSSEIGGEDRQNRAARHLIAEARKQACQHDRYERVHTENPD